MGSERIAQLPPEMQDRVLRLVGEPGMNLRAFARSLERASAGEIARAIKEGREQVDGDAP
jgi:hypothetical protein